MDINQAQDSLKKLNSEIYSLTPSALIILFEVDASNLSNDLGIDLTEEGNIFRFHNNVKLLNTSIFWQGKEYVAAPIHAEGFEISSKGTLPTPRLALSVNADGIPALALLKSAFRKLDDLVGAKVTRRRTFAKFLDAENFSDGNYPQGFSPDPNAEFSKDIFFVDRKSAETKNAIEYELASKLDLEGIKLPRRRIFANRCMWQYRGEGCLYEYENGLFSHRVVAEHGKASDSTLPTNAPPVATANDELIKDIIGVPVNSTRPLPYNKDTVYNKGDSIYIEKNNIKYYFVAKVSNPTKPPPDLNNWVPDSCSHTIYGCKLRWLNNENSIGNGSLPFGGFPAANKVR